MVESDEERFVDDDPEYALDAEDDVDLEVAELAPRDVKSMPEDLGDPGRARAPEDTA